MITIKTEKDIKAMTEGGKILAEIMQRVKEQVKPGVKTKELNETAKGLILKYGAESSFEGYRSPAESAKRFPAVLCTSINEQVVHGVPSRRVLKKGDILSLDLGIFYKGFHTDMAITLPVGKVSKEAQKLILVTKRALELGIEKIKPKNRFGDISHAIQKYVESQGFNVVRELAGHGIGRELHEDPQISNYGEKEKSFEIKEGMTICIEPMVTIGDWHTKKTNCAFVTHDGSLSAHFEHTIAVTKKEPKILTDLI